jgi:hypothetical protein
MLMILNVLKIIVILYRFCWMLQYGLFMIRIYMFWLRNGREIGIYNRYCYCRLYSDWWNMCEVLDMDMDLIFNINIFLFIWFNY